MAKVKEVIEALQSLNPDAEIEFIQGDWDLSPDFVIETEEGEPYVLAGN